MTNRDLSCYGDSFKDAYNFRPGADHMARVAAMTDEEYAVEVERLNRAVADEIAWEQANDLAASRRLVKHLSKMRADHGVCIKTALRWDMQAEAADDAHQYAWDHRVPSGYVTRTLREFLTHAAR